MRTYWNINNGLRTIDTWQPGCWTQVTCPNDEDISFKAGERLYSLYVFPVIQEPMEVVDELSESERGAAWAGSAGK